MDIKTHAGLIFLSLSTERILLILENRKWTIPTFIKKNTIFKDVQWIFEEYNQGIVVPAELYTSVDGGFQFGTYVCAVPGEFLINSAQTYAWASLYHLPNNLHIGLKNTLSNIDVKKQFVDLITANNDHN